MLLPLLEARLLAPQRISAAFDECHVVYWIVIVGLAGLLVGDRKDSKTYGSFRS